MTFEELKIRLNVNLCALNNSSLEHAKFVATAMEGLLDLFKRKLSLLEPKLEEDEETNGDIFKYGTETEDYFHVFAEMPNGTRKWYQGKKCVHDPSKVSHWELI